jgi:trehalose 6-phosphate phosphatase
VVNLVPERAPHKGDALLALRAKEGADTALYVGDDITDEDVFELDQPGRLLSIRVGQSKRSAAAYFLRNQREIDVFLDRLVKFRS